MTAITIIMSRSYKSTPIFKAHMGYGKKRANRAVRNRMNRGEFDVLRLIRMPGINDVMSSMMLSIIAPERLIRKFNLSWRRCD
ncbi:hypothetical protein [Lactiplantibacillus plantarum]|uniref:hypothetical protein n=1 Tax=Lactiplantibacillus plantarum TaxID=1590 RepID=UPI00157F5C4E|nr:hypothetical protein [Lactiplantibacillus plantarum]BEI52317.1 hypothetical protein AWA2045_04480 [Lactiplantibacillus plantarum]BEI63006.1 hypothetical protein IYO1511_c04910 [Lactiplantibacillus plantarum]GIP78787.1 hypothetical protein ITOLOC_27820 [Lactiplantibacillus plantarum]